MRIADSTGRAAGPASRWRGPALLGACTLLGLLAPALGTFGVVAGLIFVLGVSGSATRALAARIDLLGDRGGVAGAYAGVALAVLALWWIGTVVGTGRWSWIAAIVIGAGLVGVAARVLGGARTAGHAAWNREADGPTSEPARPLAALRAAAVVAALLVLVPFLVHGTSVGEDVRKVGMTDWYKHLLVGTALDTAPSLPPANPFLLEDELFVYYWGFQLVGAATHGIAGGDGSLFHALVLLTLLTAFASPFVLYRFARLLGLEPRTAVLAGIGGTLLAGFDLLVMSAATVRDLIAHGLPGLDFRGLRDLVPSTHLNFWIHHNARQFNPPYVATIWAPQHWIATLLAVLAIGLLLQREGTAAPTGAAGDDNDRSRILLAALLLAATTGISTYVAVGTGIVIGTIAFASLALEGTARAWKRLRQWAVAGALASLLAAPILWLLGRGARNRLEVELSPAGGLINGAVFTAFFGDYGWTRLLDTPAVFLLQLGVVGLLGGYELAHRLRRPKEHPEPLDLIAAAPAVLLLVVVFIRPTEAPNNFYARPMLLAWSMLVPLAAVRWRRRSRGIGWRVALGVCFAGTLYATVGATAEGYFFRPSSGDAVAVSRWVTDHTDPGAIVAVRPEDFTSDFGYWLPRRLLVTDRRNALLFGATETDFDATQRALSAAFAADDSREVARRFDALDVDVGLTREPPAWIEGPCFRSTRKTGWWIVERVRGACR